MPTLFPAKVGRFVLDGVVPPDLTSSELSQGQARGFEEATRAYVANCIKRRAPARSDRPSMRACSGCVTSSRGWMGSRCRVTTDAKITELNEAWAAIGLANRDVLPAGLALAHVRPDRRQER
jgi:hypothetical protein